jgi:hypothetical protein
MESYPLDCLITRLSTGLGNKGGGRGSLTRCVSRLGGLKRALSTTSAKNEEAKEKEEQQSSVMETVHSLSKELQLSRIELTKLFILAQRQEEELDVWEERMNTNASIKDSAAEQQAVQKLRQELQRASSTVAAKAEYEQTAKLLFAQHPTPTQDLEQDIHKLKAELQEAERASELATRQMNVRVSQFQLLMQCMLDLKQSLTIDKESGLFVPDTTANDQKQEGDADQPSLKRLKQRHQQPGSQISNKADDVVLENDDEEDEEGALYDDL